ncbi:VOC family protein [Nocardioides euryhalodurans]|uniref:VOC family protein n=1 Tax=Nocardioides euryhalodurans TaxID=2518370 RepID=A0A4P7GH84_9ACTN|nr:VOC family protein [Nocardioides euryhalodurans]QBR91017.1 VOC family protein [Nocardioides euryhalodurans]
MTAKTVQVTFDCADPRALSLFWNEVLGYELPPPPPGFESWDAFAESLPPEHRNSASACQDPAGEGPRLFFQRVPEGKAAKNRVHLDVRAAPGLEGEERMAALEAEAGRLVGLGATRVERHEPAPPLSGGHVVMLDPEGNEFCLD